MYGCCKIVIASEAKRSHTSRREDCHAPDGARKDKSQVIGHLVESAKILCIRICRDGSLLVSSLVRPIT